MTAGRPISLTPPRRGALAAASLQERLAAGELRAALTFAGQGSDPLPELEALLLAHPALAADLTAAEAALGEVAASDLARQLGAYRHGTGLSDWVRDPLLAPPEADRRAAELSYPLILTAQLLLWNALATGGLGQALLAGGRPLAAGHSQGLLAALAVSEALAGGDDGRIAPELLGRYVRLAAALGLSLSAASSQAEGTAAGDDLTPMLAVRGVELDHLRALIDAAAIGAGDLARAHVAIVHAPRAVVVSGTPAALAALRHAIEQLAIEQAAAAKAGQLGGAPLSPTLEALPVAAPFHSPLLAGAREPLQAWLDGPGAGHLPQPGALRVLCPLTGQQLSSPGELQAALLAGQTGDAALRWDRSLEALRVDDADWILDLGPGTAIARLSGELLRGTGMRSLGLASPDGRRVLTTPASHPVARDLTYAELVPGLVELPDGQTTVDTPFTRLHGAPPVVLAGMTPTTSDAGIVAAAANAGFVAELAGGGQPDERTFQLRIEELQELLEPGREAIFNTLLLDRHLWQLHVDGAGLVPAARAEGAPLGGLTVSAGIPDVEAATALLDRLAAAGLRRNAFKPGTVEQIRQVLAIARAAPHHVITMQVEGGQGGGHHSWLDLEHLLLETYDEIRRRENVVLAVGGGVGTPARAADLLTGQWSLRRGEAVPMPVDAVLIGTAAMACAEAAASPQVKQALVQAAGVDGWVPRNGVSGGVTSATSNLNADIHLLESAAARAGKLLQEVAGDEAAVHARRDEIIAALAVTAKPYLGDLERMTYQEVLEALTMRMAIGRGGRYDDGAWGDPSWRARVLELARQFAARLDAAEQGPIDPPLAVGSDLDDPDAALANFAAHYPHAASTLLHPADVDLVLEVCDRPGKPVPFVPVLDGEVRRWFMADALWQAQDDRHSADAVFVIPGPVSVAGIERADEPVADLLGRFHAAAITALQQRGVMPCTRDRLATHGPGPQPAARLAASSDGPIGALLAAPALTDASGRSHANPLWRLLAPGDTITARRTDRGGLEQLTATPQGAAPGEELELRVGGAGVQVRCSMPRPSGPPATLAFGVQVLPGGTCHAPELVDALGSFARAALDCGPAEPGRWSCAAGLPAAYARATGAAHGEPAPDLAFTLAWPTITAVLRAEPALTARLPELLHAAHEVQLDGAWPPLAGASGTATAWISAIDDRRGAASRATVITELRVADGECLATVTTELVFPGPAPLGGAATLRRDRVDRSVTLDAASLEALAALPGLTLHPSAQPGAVLELRGELLSSVRHERPGDLLHDATGLTATINGVTAWEHSPATITEPAGTGRPAAHPLRRWLDALDAPGTRGATPAAGEPEALARIEDAAPHDLTSFALVGGDGNPLHRSVLAARLAGLDAPIVHGMWLSARAAAAVIDGPGRGRAAALTGWRMQFLGPVAPGAVLEFELRAIGRAGGERLVEVVVYDGEAPVARGHGRLELGEVQRRALLFPGQGIQRPDMATPVLLSSRAAREVWAAAEAHCVDELGFSLDRLVERNPRSWRLGGEVVSHPGGLLMRTEYTQPALVALAAAQLAALREAGQLPARGGVPLAAGHSVGEFSALLALGVLDLATALTLVHRRGQAMQAHVPRDAQGRSPYRMAVVDPSLMGSDHDGLRDLVARHAPLAEIVNENARDRQYAIVGPADELGALAAAHPAEPGRRPAVRVLDAIDVPFHSSVLRPAASALLADLESLIVAVDPARVVGRWVPNLIGRPFALSDEFASAVIDAAGLPERVTAALPAADRPDERARWLLITALAGQLAAPVRWIDTLDILVAGDGGRRETLIEVAPGHATVLTGLARLSDLPKAVRVLHCELDRGQLDALTEPGRPAAVPAPGPSVAAAKLTGDGDSTAAPPASPPRTAASSGQPVDQPGPTSPSGGAVVSPSNEEDLQALSGIDAGLALHLVLALQARVRLEQVPAGETLDELFEGVSSRRNQVLIDLGREFSLTGAEGAQQRTIGELTRQLQDEGGRYRYPGDYLRVAIDTALSAGLASAGLSRSAATGELQQRFGVSAGFSERVLAELALELREGASARGGALGHARPSNRAEALERLITTARRCAQQDGVTLPDAPATATSQPAAATELPSAAREALQRAATELLSALDAPGDDAPPAPAQPANSRGWSTAERELGPDLLAALTPAFDARRHVRLDDAWAHARWDLLNVVHATLRGDSDPADAEHALRRLAPFGRDPQLAATAQWLAGRVPSDHPVAALLQRELARLSAGKQRVPALTPAGSRPEPVMLASGVPGTQDAADPSRPGDLPSHVQIAGDRTLEQAAAADLADALEWARDLSGEVALVTGAAPGSIGAAVVAQLLRGGATVVATASALTPARRRWAAALYRETAAPGAALHLLPANLASTTDIDALVAWLAAPQTPQRQRPDLELASLLPTLVFPLAAISTTGEAGAGAGDDEHALRVQVTGIHRLLAQLADHATPHAPTTVVLPLSPNHGTFGHDGLYGETKAALEVLLQRGGTDEAWAQATRLIGTRIGWVRGTGLMQAADAIAADVERELGVRTFSSEEAGLLLTTVATGAVRDAATPGNPLLVDLSGGLPSDQPLRPRLAPFIAAAEQRAERHARTVRLTQAIMPPAHGASERPRVQALPSAETDRAAGIKATLARAEAWPKRPDLPLDRFVAIAGTGELGPAGSGRTRWALEQAAQPSPGTVAELAWLCGLVHYERAGYRGRWIDDVSGEPVPESELAERYGDAVAERTGLRPLEADPTLDPAGLHQLAPLVAAREAALRVESPEQAEPFLAATPGASLRRGPSGDWEVLLPAGTQLRLPRQIAHSRRVAGQLPRGLDLGRLGAPADLVATADRMALVDLLCTVEAFTSAGLEPGELLEHVHPTQIASTQGAGLGGLASLRRLLLDQLLAENRAPDRIQESLGNVVAAHVVQAFVGSYGPMLHPVGACATAAVSLEAGRDLILAGKALAVVAGGFDDLTAEGLTGFGDMGATASSDELEAMGIEPREASRPGDVRRGGFVEAQGGGAQLLVRGDLAVALGLPVRGVLMWAGSFADGLQRSIPAPGLGLLGAAAGGASSPLAAALAAHGLAADDLGVVSKHDTSTELNDPGEADLHHRIQRAIGRTPGNPLPVISQKSLTGHSKGGAAAWQVDGLLRVLEDQVIPGNRTLECADPLLAGAATLAVGGRTFTLAPQLPLRAGLVSSLGFGHISALVAIADPAALVAAIEGDQARADYLRRAGARRAAGAQRLLAARCGRPLATRRPAPDASTRDRDAEAERLLAPVRALAAPEVGDGSEA